MDTRTAQPDTALSPLSLPRGGQPIALAPTAIDRRPAVAPAGVPAAAPALQVVWARHLDEVRAAQRLRHRVFAQELGARLSCPPGTPEGLDVDRYDDWCEHLLVRTLPQGDAPAEVVGTYRVLTPAGAVRAGGLYSEGEFDLWALAPLRPALAELGRSCTAPGWRGGGVVMLLWSALVDFMHHNGLRHMVGCASIGMHDGGHAAASLWQRLRQQCLAPHHLRVKPWLPLPVDQLRSDLPADAPPLVKGYLRCGAQVLGAPAWDPDFNVADLPMLLALDDLPQAYRRRFSRGATAGATDLATGLTAAGPPAEPPAEPPMARAGPAQAAASGAAPVCAASASSWRTVAILCSTVSGVWKG